MTLLRLLLLSAVLSLTSIPVSALTSAKQGWVTFDSSSFSINGKRTFLLIGSFQYFRVDPSDWDRWLQSFQESGYNTVDCYVPWNFHEPTEGKFDFTSPTHDLPRFLRLCEKHHLFVQLRGGPYICSEWDGGGIPAWTIPKQDFALRTDNPAFLSCLRPYLRQMDSVIRPFQITHGGPIIMVQLENEHDYFGQVDGTHTLAYLSDLHHFARNDGIDVPLTACVGTPTGGLANVIHGTGLADDVVPTGNFYVSGNIENDAASFVKLLHSTKYTGGLSMSDVPVVCTETDRDQNVQRRLIAGGLKGVAPFLFVSGSNNMFNNGDTNWANPVCLISSSYDFGGMISFSGSKTQNWYDARRLAGTVHSFEDEICQSTSDTNWEGGFSVTNSQLGASEDAAQPNRVYRLKSPDNAQFFFLWNATDTSQLTSITSEQLTFPRHSIITVQPHYDPILVANLPLSGWGLPGILLRYSTSEIYSCVTAGDTTTVQLTGPQGDVGEMSFNSPPQKFYTPSTVSHYMDGGDWTVTYTVDPSSNFGVRFGSHNIHIEFKSLQQLGPTKQAQNPPVMDLTTENVWRDCGAEKSSTPKILLGNSPQPLETNGILKGAATYQATFTCSGQTTPGPQLELSSVSDIATVSLNGVFLGTIINGGRPASLPTDDALVEGTNKLTVRAEIWGHSNFNDSESPCTVMNSPRGLVGTVSIGGQPLSPQGSWTLSQMESNPPASAETKSPIGPLTPGSGGSGRWHERTFTLPSPLTETGYVLTSSAQDVLCHVFVNGHPVGRLLFGPTADPHVGGGPSDRLYIPAAWLHDGKEANIMCMFVVATSSQSVISSLTLSPSPE